MRPATVLVAALVAVGLPSTDRAHAQTFAEGAARAQRVDIAAHVREASARFGLPEAWIFAVIRIESAGRIRAVSPAGAMGLMQLMPGTWACQRARFALGPDPFDPRDNIMAGTSYLREMYDRYGAQGFLAAYNAGPGRYEAWLYGRRSLPLETRRYVARLAPMMQADRVFVSAAILPIREPPLGGEVPAGVPAEPAGQAAHAARDNPFAAPAHDLFAPTGRGDTP